MTIHPLNRRQRTRLGDILEKVSVGLALAYIGVKEFSFSHRAYGMMAAAVFAAVTVRLEAHSKRRR